MTQTLLKVQNITRRFGGLVAVDNVSFDVVQGEVLTIIGPNGAGKSTLFNVISRIYPQSSGSFFLKGWILAKRPRTTLPIWALHARFKTSSCLSMPLSCRIY